MANQKPLVLDSGTTQQLPNTDTLLAGVAIEPSTGTALRIGTTGGTTTTTFPGPVRLAGTVTTVGGTTFTTDATFEGNVTFGNGPADTVAFAATTTVVSNINFATPVAYKITNLANGTNPNDAVNLSQLSGFVTSVGASAPLSSSGGATPNISLTGTVGVANGGTGTSTAFTPGSVVFAGASGVYTQDNANLFFDDTNNRLGIGRPNPTYTLEVASPANDGVNVIMASGTPADRPLSTLTRVRGSVSSPTGLLSGDLLGDFAWAGSTSASALSGSSRIRSTATEAWAFGAVGSDMRFLTVPNGTGNPVEAMRIADDGRVSIGTATPNERLTVNGVLSIAEGTAPSLTSGFGKFYALSTDSRPYFLDDGGQGYNLTLDRFNGLTAGATVTINTAPNLPVFNSVTLNQNTAFATSNLGNGRSASVRVVCDATTRTLTFPGTWTWLGSGPPASLAANDVGYLSITAYGTTDADVVAAWSYKNEPAAVTGTGTATRVAFWNGTTALSSNANLYWDNTNSRLGVNTATPSTAIDLASGQLAIPDGTAAAPAIAFRDDLNCGFFSPANDIVGISVAGAEVARFQQTGANLEPTLLLGTSTASANLTVDAVTSVAGAAFIAHGAAGTAFQESYRGGQYAGLRTRGTKASPTQIGADDGMLSLFGAGWTATSTINYGALITMKAEQAFTSAASGGRIEFHTTPNNTDGSTTLGGATTERMRITNGGLVGVGTATPNERLTVNGSLSLAEGTAPSLTAGFGKFYALSTDSRPYFLDDGGQAYNLTLDRFNTLTPAASVAIDTNPSLPVFNSLAISQNTTFTTSNLGNGRSASIRISNATASSYTLTWPGTWTWLGTGAPTSIAANTTGYLSITAYGATDANVVAAWSFSGTPASVTGLGAATRVAFWNGTTALSSNANLYWDNTNSRLGIGTAVPSVPLQVAGGDALVNGITVGRGNTGAAATSTAVGVSALALATGADNTAVGNLAADVVSTGTQNTAVGSSALGAATTTSNSTAVGFNALLLNTAAGNTAVGSRALDANTTGTGNVAVGLDALGANATGIDNTAIGNAALSAATALNGSNTAVGANALLTLTTGDSCTAVGKEALRGSSTNVPTGSTAVGASALAAISTGQNNTAMGYFAGSLVTTTNNNSYFGFLAGQKISGSVNTGVGYAALGNGTGGGASSNTAVGSQALGTLQTGFENVAIGREAAFALVSGGQNVAVGAYALSNATTNGSNVAVGFSALLVDTLGTNSVAVGMRALDSQNPAAATAMNNVAVGSDAGGSVTTGTDNTLVGTSAGFRVTTGNNNVIIGDGADVPVGFGNSDNTIVIGQGATSPAVLTNTATLGNSATDYFRLGTTSFTLPNPGIDFSESGGFGVGASPLMRIGHTSSVTSSIFIGFYGGGGLRGRISGDGAGGVNYTSISDYRLKSEIQDIENPVDRLLLLHPCSFRMTGATPEAKRVEGFIAHEVQAVVPEAVNGTKDAVDDEGAPQYQSLDQSRLVPLLTAACQELAAKAAAAEARADAAEARLAALEEAVLELLGR